MDERKLAGLTPARRNRYYYGKLMDVLHFSMEQQYVLAKEWLLNRAVIGPGVVCGLDVKAVSGPSGAGIVIGPGLAFDGWGREIVVPEPIQLVPLQATDECGGTVGTTTAGTPPSTSTPGLGTHVGPGLVGAAPAPAPTPAPAAPPSGYVVKICYAECCTDFAPAMVADPDCGCGGDCEPGTIVETYCVKVLPGADPPVTEPCLEAVMKGLKAGKLHAVLCELSQACAAVPDDPCITLANVAVGADGTLTVDSCSPRPIAPTNRILMQLISCLADCCGGKGVTPPPPSMLQVTGVRVLTLGKPQAAPNDPALTVVGELAPPNQVIKVSAERGPAVIEIAFDPSVAFDPSSVIVGDSLAVTGSKSLYKLFTGMPGNVLRVQRLKGFQAGSYKFELRGNAGAGGAAPHAILAQDGTPLDGEFPTAGGAGWHSGDGTAGGNFIFELEVVK